MLNKPYSSQRILIFDSGIGGLSVLRSAFKHEPHHCYSYLADNAWWPYGPKSPESIQQRLHALFKHIDINSNFDMVVLACNTASTSALTYLRKHFDTPFIGVVPAIKPAAQLSTTKTIALLATQTTVSGDYVKALKVKYASDCTIVGFALPQLVELSEYAIKHEGSAQHDAYLHDGIASVISTIKSHPLSQQLDCFVLGCTHFPLLKDALAAQWGKPAHWVDSGFAIAQRIEQISGELSNNKCRENRQGKAGFLWLTQADEQLLRYWQPHFETLGILDAQVIENIN
ncbi:MAG: glutamate racemase [Sinobacterium sp.]|nr:glutamate racemase [Sinobacterium sp.]